MTSLVSFHIDTSLTTSAKLNIIHFWKLNQINSAVLTLDAEKMFDFLEPQFLLTPLKLMAFGPNFLWAKAQVSVNSFLSDDFILTKGSCYSCPLSPLLFAFCCNPLPMSYTTILPGAHVGNHTYKLNLFADNGVIFLSNPSCSLPPLLEAIEAFGPLLVFI